MNSILGIGFAELIVILILAGLLLGPHRIRQVARQLGRLTVQLQAVSRQFTRQLHAELDALDMEEIKGAMQDVKDLQQQVESLRRELRDASQEFIGEGRTAVQEGESLLKNASSSLRNDGLTNKIDPHPAHDAPAVSSAADGNALPRALDVPDDPEV
jgi:Sec-independent protein translocase protein TatA